MVRMKDGTEVEDPRLGRLQEFDERSRNYPIMAAVSAPKPRSYTWRYDGSPVDQGNVGACVSYSILGSASLARPAALPFDLSSKLNRAYMLSGYCDMQRIDPWAGVDEVCDAFGGIESPTYGGTSVLAGLKVAVERGHFKEYRWAFGIEQGAIGVGRNGPAILGTWWRGDMSRPDSSGLIRYSGSYEGGHAYLWAKVDISGVKNWLDGEAMILNSWGPWGLNGWARIPLRDVAQSLDEQGECAFALKRKVRPRALVEAAA